MNAFFHPIYASVSAALKDPLKVGLGAGSAGSWLPSRISENARWFVADQGITSSNSTTVYSWVTKRDDRNWGDWIGRDSVFTYTDGGKLYMLGGWSNGNVAAWNNQFLTNELWESRDSGVSWDLVIADATSPTIQPTKRHLGARCYATFDGVDYVYLMGGKLDVSGGPQAPQTVDVWRKPLDGNPLTPWELVTANAGVGARDNMFMGSLDGVLYAGGGYTGVGNTIGSGLGIQQDLWKSEDEGATWTLVTATAPWGLTAACGQELLEKDGKLWLFGGWEATTGFDAYTCRNDVWTYDGANFVEVLADGHAQWSRRFYHNVALMDGQFFIIGGHAVDSSNVTDSGYRSTDGVTWTALPSKPYPNIHACSMWVVGGKELVIQNGLIVPGGPFSRGVFSLSSYTAPRVDSWAGQGAGSLTLTASSTARPYEVTGALATGKKTVYFDAAQHMSLASADSFSGSATILVAGKFPHFTTGCQAIVGSAAAVQFGVQGVGPYATDSSSDNVMARGHAKFIQRGEFRCIALSMDGSECKMRVDGDLLETDGETFTLSNWSRVGGGYTATADNLKGHIFAIAIIPDVEVTQAEFLDFQAWAFARAGLVQETSAEIAAIEPDQLLLQDGKRAHYSPEEDATKTHLLRDYAGTIPGFAPQNCLSGNGSDYATVAFSTYRPGRTSGPVIVEFSVKTPGTIASSVIICSHNSTDNLFHWLIQIAADGKLNWYNRTHISGSVTSSATLSANTWYRVKYVRTGSTGNWTLALYLNGVLDSTTTGITEDPASDSVGNAFIFHSAGAFSRFSGSIADVRLTHDGHKWFIPLTEGSRPNLYCYRSDGLMLTQSSLTDVALWAGVKTEPSSMCPNWLLNYGGKIELSHSTILPGYLDLVSVGGASTDDQKPDFFASRFANGTINCDPLSLGSGGLGLETALTPTTERKTASSGKRRRRVSYGRVDRLAANATAMNSATANEYFGD